MAVAHGFAIFYRRSRVKLIRDCPVPCPGGGTGQNLDHAAILVIFEAQRSGRYASEQHISSATMPKGFKKLGQTVALLSAAKAQMRWNPMMPLVLTGDYNAVVGSLLAEFVLAGSADLSLMPAEHFSKLPLDQASGHVDESHLEKSRTFKVETRALRDVMLPKTIATKADEFRAIIREVLDTQDMVAKHPVRLSSVYDSTPIVDFILHGSFMSPRLKLVSRLELPDRMLQRSIGLPAGRLGSDHFAIAAKLRFLDEVDEVDEDLEFDEDFKIVSEAGTVEGGGGRASS
ncbi:unnamed protein product [Mortierella alpina]